jgi:hypothetical protein
MPEEPFSKPATDTLTSVLFVASLLLLVTNYHLRVSTNPDCAALVVDPHCLRECCYTNVTVLPETSNYWRMNTSNDGRKSDWATNIFTTLPPMVQVLSRTAAWPSAVSRSVILTADDGGVRRPQPQSGWLNERQ